MHDVGAFYDGLAPLYHLVYEDWDASIARQGAALAAIITDHWGSDARRVLDASVGIGTQALGLLAQGFAVVGSDLSLVATRRAWHEAARRRARLPAVVADFRALPHRSTGVDVVLLGDNSLPHLDTEEDIERALRECLRCARPAGGCLITMRDYGSPPPPGTVELKPYGERTWKGGRYTVRQVWTWRGARYDVAMEITPVDGGPDACATTLTTSYLAIAPARVAALMAAAGFEKIERLDGRFFQPVLVGTRPTLS